MADEERVEDYRKAHEEGREEELHGKLGGRYLGDMVYGANDGIITTFAVVSAVMGASLQPFIVLIIGFANLLADGFSMAAGDYLATKSNKQYRQRQRDIEEWEVENLPEEERKEVEDIYRQKGFTGQVLEKIVDHITGDKDRWVETMMMQELNMPPDDDVIAWKKGFATFVAFVIAGFMPLLPYAFTLDPLFPISIAITGITLFTVGALRSLVTARPWFRSGMEMLLVGALAAMVAYGIGYLLQGVVPAGAQAI